MGFPESVIASDEDVVLHLRPHWKVLIVPVLGFVLVVAALSLLAVVTPWQEARLAIVVVASVLILVITVWPLVTWATTHVVFTTHRVILRTGVFSRTGRDIPHARINDVSFEQTLLERILRCGTLTVASASEYGQVVLRDVPRVERTQGVLYQLVEADHERRAARPLDDPGY